MRDRSGDAMTRRAVRVSLVLSCVALGVGCRALPEVIPNDNRVAAGHTQGALRSVRLEAMRAGWRPDLGVDSSITVSAFAEHDGVPRIPGPLVRATAGDTIAVTVVNTLRDDTLTVHGLVPGAADSLRLRSGDSATVRFVAGAPGTYLYWGTSTGSAFGDRSNRDSQLTGAIVIDPVGIAPDTAERIFVITTLDVLPDTTKPPGTTDDLFDQAINGRSWPHTERLQYAVGDTARWRFVNGGYLPHPMHLHGFHFRVLAKGDGSVDTLYAPTAARTVVTELMPVGSTFQMAFVPTRAGQWLFHCHMVAHVTPFPERPDAERAHGFHDPTGHALTGMSGLVMGIEVRGPMVVDETMPAERRWLYVRQAAHPVTKDSVYARGYALWSARAPALDSAPATVSVPGPTLLLTRGVRTAVTVVNRLPEPTTVHWHGMELESYFDGVAGWSGAGERLAPMIAPGDSFTVVMTPPRAGTFMYHPHMEEEDQLQAGLFGALIVLEPGERFDARHDLPIVIGESIDGEARGTTINGRFAPAPIDVQAGQTYRLRVMNIQATVPLRLMLHTDSTPQQWRWVAKDGAPTDDARRTVLPPRVTIGVGETYDFLWTPTRSGAAEFLVIPPPRDGLPNRTLTFRIR